MSVVFLVWGVDVTLAFGALTLLVGQQKGIQSVKK